MRAHELRMRQLQDLQREMRVQALLTLLHRVSCSKTVYKANHIALPLGKPLLTRVFVVLGFFCFYIDQEVM